MPLALEQIRRMRGGAQSQLMRCADGGYYVVKFQNNPQGTRVLANELLANRLAARLGLPVPDVGVVEVGEELIRKTDELVIELGRGRQRCLPGLQFGSKYPGDPAAQVVHDFLPDEQLRQVLNLRDFAGMLVFDKWTCNTNGRQAIFFAAAARAAAGSAGGSGGGWGYGRGNGGVCDGGVRAGYRAVMIDNGFCFNATEWNFPDAPLRGIYLRQLVYEDVRGLDAFEPWLARLGRISEQALDEAASEIPPEWYNFDQDALFQLLEMLFRRRTRVEELLVATCKSSRIPFPNWIGA
jgi:hypothetical protein